MTTPKVPVQPGLPLNLDAEGLNDTINELDGLITNKDNTPQDRTGTTGIPVLDEIIDPDDGNYDDDIETLLHPEQLPEPGPAAQQEPISQEQLEQIIDNVEEKLAGELDVLVNILKDSIKDSIMTEIKTQLESGLNTIKTEKPDSDHS
jgi:hypothetical protein